MADKKLIEKLRAKVAEQKARREKAAAQWKAICAESSVTNLLNLQHQFRNLLAVGKLIQAEQVFEKIKTWHKNNRN